MMSAYRHIAESFTERTKLLLAMMLGCMLTLGFAPFRALPATVIALAGFYYLIERCATKKEVFKYATIFGFVYFLSSMYWLATPLFADIKSYYFVMPFSLGLTPFILSLFISIPAIFTTYFEKRVAKIIIFSLSVAILELIRTYAIPFPWNLFGYASSGSKYLMQSVGLITIHGMSFAMIFISIAIFSGIRMLSVIAILAAISLMSFGYYIFNFSPSQTHSLNVRLVQPNFGYFYNINYNESHEKFDELISVMLDDLPDNNQLIILPEGSMPFLITEYQDGRVDQAVDLLTRIAAGYKTKILLPANYASEKDGKHYNSLLLIGKDGLEQRYFKRILVPFGEYLPFEKIIGRFINPIAANEISFTKGQKSGNFEYAGLTFALSICFESIFPQLFNKKNTIIVNVTNDSWLGKTIGPEQHFDMLRFRAIETQSKILRVANTGITAVIDERGNPLNYIDQNQKSILDLTTF